MLLQKISKDIKFLKPELDDLTALKDSRVYSENNRYLLIMLPCGGVQDGK